ncbi:hypothetical protein A9Q99_16450 [Gammaproteobacteria bacterium 45_16_T64]|nr:hypothetical protein A9Q99_16450 [Gammaproteobacteria bacterium 45_16_T64]
MIHSTTAPSILYLWERRTLYIGEYSEFVPLTQGAASLMIAIDGPITIELPNTSEVVSVSSALIPAGVTFKVDTHGHRIANCYLDPYNEDFFRLKQIMQNDVGGIYVNSKKEIMQAAALEKMLCHNVDQKEAAMLLENAVFPSFFEAPKRNTTDPRIIEIIDFIKGDPTVNHTNKDMAKRINVSEVTLQRLFKATTGIPIRRFRLWHRLYVTATLLAFGRSITEAALEAGFSDASHFNHVFKDMLGMCPSSIIRRTQNMSIFVDESALRNQLSAVS